MSDLHGRITAALLREDQLRVCKLSDADIKFMADAVIRKLPELRRIAQVREVCVAILNAERVPGEALNDRAWLADTVLNVLNGEVDE